MDPTILAYIAGIVDGEGCIQIVRQKAYPPAISVRHNAGVTIGMCDEELICWIIAQFPDLIRFYHKKSRHPHQRDAYHAIAVSHKAAEFLRAIRPYLRLKRRQADLAIEFTERMINGRVLTPVGQGYARISDAEIAIREEMHQTMRDLNLRGKGVQTTNPRSRSSLAADYPASEEG
jgi:hypothetical protein